MKQYNPIDVSLMSEGEVLELDKKELEADLKSAIVIRQRIEQQLKNATDNESAIRALNQRHLYHRKKAEIRSRIAT